MELQLQHLQHEEELAFHGAEVAADAAARRGRTYSVPLQHHGREGEGLPGACRALRGSHLMRRFFQHMFCKFCGVQCYYSPRSNPDGWGVTLACVDPGTITKAEIREVRGFDVARGVCGQRWLTTWATVRRTKLGSVSCVVWHRSILQGVSDTGHCKNKKPIIPQVGFEPTRDFLPAHLKCDPLTTPALWTFPHRSPNSQ